MAQLRVAWSSDEARIGHVAPISESILRIGREQQSDGLWLADARLSRLHARLSFDSRSGGVRIGDGQSRNGTFVNGARIETALLSAGDVIRAGNSLLIYEERDAFAEVQAQAAAAAKLSTNVLIRGETGTGKELLARSLHAKSGRSGAFVALNCGGVPIDLLAAELFGHTKTAFSGAGQARKGVFAEADGGTLLLDEIGDCPMPIQIALLRALQEKAIRPVGAEREVPVDVRVVAATHCDLESAIEGGTFRADLYARLAQVTLPLPPLRARRGQILELLQSLAQEQGYACSFSADAAEALLCWSWPFNVRELQSLLHSCAVRGLLPGVIGIEQLREAAPAITAPFMDRRARPDSGEVAASVAPPATTPHQNVRQLLLRHGGNVSAVAQELGKPRAQVYRWLKSMGVSPNKFRK
jgi:DNA-binding NtrC family response regulator